MNETELAALVEAEGLTSYGAPENLARHKGLLVYAAYRIYDEFDTYEVQVYNKERMVVTPY